MSLRNSTVRLMLTPTWVLGLTLLMSGHSQASPQYDYLLHCSGCHLENGGGSPPIVPDLRGTMAYLAGFDEGRSYMLRVPGASQAPVSDKQLSDIMNWMLKRYAPESPEVKAFDEAEVSESRATPLLNAGALRERLLGES